MYLTENINILLPFPGKSFGKINDPLVTTNRLHLLSTIWENLSNFEKKGIIFVDAKWSLKPNHSKSSVFFLFSQQTLSNINWLELSYVNTVLAYYVGQIESYFC